MGSPAPPSPDKGRRWPRAVVGLSVLLVVAGSAGFLADPLHLPDELLAVLDQRASVISMGMGMAGLLVAGLALWVQVRSSAAPDAGTGTAVPPSGPDSPVMGGPALTGAGAVAVSGSHVDHIGDVVYRAPRPRTAGRPTRLAPRPPQLTGREEDLDALRRRLAAAPHRPGVLAVHGLGGVGKTSLVLEHAHRHLHTYDLVWQIPAEDPTVASATLAALAALLGVRDADDTADPIDQVHAALAARTTPWLLIFDNASDASAVQELLPPAGPGHILITSRSGAWPPAQSLELDVLDRDEAAAFLLERTADDDPATAAALAHELGALPLALEQAGAYVSDTGSTLADYLRMLRTQRATILAQGKPWGYRQRVASTWQLSFDQLADHAPQAIALLRLLACYAPEAIPYRLLLDQATTLGAGTGALPRDTAAVNAAVAALRRYSLLSRPVDGMVSLHRLVRAVTLDQLSTRERERWRASAAALLEGAVPDDPHSSSAWPRFAQLLPHVRALLPADSRGLWDTARYLGVSGDYHTAVLLFQEITQQCTTSLGPEDPDTLAARHDLGRWTGWAGDAAAARDQLAALLPVRARVLGPEHPHTLNTRHDLAVWTGKAGDAAAARDQLAALLLVQERISGPEHLDTLATRHSVAWWTGEAGDAAAARDQLAALLPVQVRVSGPEHPHTLFTQHDLAWYTGKAGDPSAARDQLTALLPARVRVSGPEHPYTLNTRHDLAIWTGEAGDGAAAHDQLRTLLPIRERVLGPEHPGTLATRHELVRWADEGG
ncbi:FxSxx-COOH system tetratricopeptide repeat protein [Nonomuraea sp. NPDC050783]|uniref:FxSxx-COOH system tetratricopeptide repeat protein n=1 Tax=Nonomuraea sp. NPDC050783 TaxID=3154634 RepID=UPI003466E689